MWCLCLYTKSSLGTWYANTDLKYIFLNLLMKTIRCSLFSANKAVFEILSVSFTSELYRLSWLKLWMLPTTTTERSTKRWTAMQDFLQLEPHDPEDAWSGNGRYTVWILWQAPAKINQGTDPWELRPEPCHPPWKVNFPSEKQKLVCPWDYWRLNKESPSSHVIWSPT